MSSTINPLATFTDTPHRGVFCAPLFVTAGTIFKAQTPSLQFVADLLYTTQHTCNQNKRSDASEGRVGYASPRLLCWSQVRRRCVLYNKAQATFYWHLTSPIFIYLSWSRTISTEKKN